MTLDGFHEKLKQHCNRIEGNCRQCCYIDYCYSQKRDIHKDFLEEIISHLSNQSDNDKDISVQVIHNRYNSYHLEENNGCK